jgi:hypothetical protein
VARPDDPVEVDLDDRSGIAPSPRDRQDAVAAFDVEHFHRLGIDQQFARSVRVTWP